MITRLLVKNYKSLRNVEVPLGPLNVFVGPNMGGKSNLIDVFRFLQEMIYPAPTQSEGLYYALAQRGGVSEVQWKGSDESNISIALDGKIDQPRPQQFEYRIEILAGPRGYAEIQEESLRLTQDGKVVDLIVREGNTRWLANINGQKIVSSSASGRSALQNAPENWSGYELARSVSTWRFYQLVPQIMKDPNPTGTGEVLDHYGKNLSSWLMTLQTRHPETFAKLDQVARDVFPDLRSLLTWPSPQGTVHLASTEKGLRRPVNVWQMSDGELVFLALLSLIYAPPEHAGDLYCIEEPENHLHPRLLNVLVTLLRQVREEIAGAGSLSQLVITTHSPYLVDQMHLDEIIWVEKKDGSTQVSRPADRKHLRKLVEDKDLGLADIVYSGTLNEQR